MQEAILFVDDEALVLEGFRRLLSSAFVVETASNAAEALSKLKKKNHFAVAVCDMCMPGMDGIQLLHKIRLDAPEVVRIMLTGAADQATAIQAVNEGNIFRFLAKPCNKDLLTTTLNDALVRFRTEKQKEELLEKARYGHGLEPWTADPSTASFREVDEKVRETLGKQAQTVQPSEGCIYMGKAIWVSSDYVVQCLNPTRAIVHLKAVLSYVPRVGEYVSIQYFERQGEVTKVGGRNP
jgi:DNA-binding NtrC family response regulator